MLSLGNDLVCLTTLTRHNRHLDGRFRQKVLTSHEQQLVGAARQPERLLWLIWSLKEAAYKYCQRLYPALTFVPTRFALLNNPALPALLGATNWQDRGFDHLPAATAQLQTPLGVVVGRTVGTEACLMSVVAASREETEAVYWEIRRANAPTAAEQSAQVRQATAARFQAEWHLPADVRVTFDKGQNTVWGAGWPVLHLNDQPHPCILSFSHDARYVAYAFTTPPAHESINQPPCLRPTASDS